jgi:type I restriction enzyme M protein
MLSPKLKQQVSNLWDMFWSAGMTNPLTSIEQITYLIFLKRLEALDVQRIKEGKPSLYGPRLHCELDHHPQDKLDVHNSLLSLKKMHNCLMAVKGMVPAAGPI